MRQPDINLEYIFRCPECGETATWTMAQVPDNGSPMCLECDQDMELADFCEMCGEIYKEQDIDGGRCTSCGTMITQKES
tara:strand:- start:133 stop:369 length:237 start_codon:yes stop_codon:yes gene_type:complete